MTKALWFRLLRKCGLINQIAWWRSRGATIGEDCAILNEVCLDPGHERLITIGNYVTIGPQAFILAHDASTRRVLGVTKQQAVVIEDYVFIGARAMILPGVTVGHNSIVGAGSIVTRDVRYGTIVCGNPAVEITTTAEFMTKRQQQLNLIERKQA